MAGFKQGFIQGLTEVSLVLKDQLGDIRIEGQNIYKYVQLVNSATVAGVAGDPVAYTSAAGDHAIAKVTLKVADALAVPVGAGFLMAAITGTLTVVYYCWILVRGPVTYNATASGTAGQIVKFGAADKSLAVCAAATDCHMMINHVIASKQGFVIAPY